MSFERREFPRIPPEEAGISSAAVGRFLDALEGPHTQMHGLMIMRGGKVCAEGWWQPYAPGKRHTCHSLTKTYMATAIGIARREGLLHLDDKLVDIFPEYREGSTIQNVTIRHLLCMGSGVTSMPQPSPDWIRDFFLQPQVYEPGTAFFYNSAGSTLLAYVIERVSGEPVYAYLKPRLFDKIGIDARVSFPSETAPENDMWGHRMQATTEDNLRLMKLYLDGGTVNGERILDEDFVAMATSFQNASRTESLHNPDAADNFEGYGFQIWMCTRPGAYRADGAGGQFSVVVPDLDLIVSISESAVGAWGAQHTLDCIWKILLPEVKEGPLPARAQEWAGIYTLDKGRFDLYYSESMSHETGGDQTGTLTFSFGVQEGRLRWQGEHDPVELTFAVDGSWRRNCFSIPFCNSDECYAAGYWESETDLTLTMFWTQAVVEKRLLFRFDAQTVTVTGQTDYMPGDTQRAKSVYARACRLPR